MHAVRFALCALLFFASPLGMTRLFALDDGEIQKLAAKVSSLTENSPDQQRKKRTLKVALEFAAGYLAANNPARASELMTDVAAAMSLPMGVQKNTNQLFFLPFSRDPQVVADFNAGVAAVLSKADTPAGVPTATQSPYKENINAIRNNGHEIFKFLVATAHPSSKFLNNPDLYERCLRRVNAYVESLCVGPEGMNVDEFFTMDNNFFGIYCFSQVYPDLLLPSQRKGIDAGVRILGAKLKKSFDARQLFHWCNANVSYASGLIHGGLLINEPSLVEMGKKVIDFHVASQFPDGGFPYTEGQNESEGYHGIMPGAFGRVWLSTRNPTALKGIVQGRNYTPLSIEPPIVGTYWTAPAWKWTWNSSYATSLEEAFHSRSPWLKTYQLVRSAYSGGRKPADFSAYAVMMDLSGIKARPLPNGYTVFDSNILGPRARYGNFSYAVVGRDVSPSSSREVGLQTFAGAMTVDNFDPKHPLPLNAAASGIFAGPRLRPQNDFRANYNIADSCVTTVLMGHDCASLTASHKLSGQVPGPKKTPSSWRGDQQWILLPYRIIGLVTVIPGKEKAFEVTGRIKLVYGGSGVMYPKEIKILDETTYSFGTLRVKIHAHNFGKIDVEKNTSTLREGRNTATDVRLRDPESVSGGDAAARDYKNPLSFLVEISPTWAPANAVIQKIESGPLRGIKVISGGRQFVSLMNTGTQTAVVRVSDHISAPAKALAVAAFQYQQASPPTAVDSVSLAPGKGTFLVAGGKSDATPPWPSFSAMMEAFSKGGTDLTEFPLPGLKYQ